MIKIKQVLTIIKIQKKKNLSWNNRHGNLFIKTVMINRAKRQRKAADDISTAAFIGMYFHICDRWVGQS